MNNFHCYLPRIFVNLLSKMTLHPKYITSSSGKKQAVVLTIEEYDHLIKELEELEDIKLYDKVKSKKESSIRFSEYLKKRKSKKQ